jgi:hypothetical protein
MKCVPVPVSVPVLAAADLHVSLGAHLLAGFLGHGRLVVIISA